MSMEQNETHDNKLLATSIKLENETDDDLSYDEAIELNKKIDYCSNLSSASTVLQPSTYKGKIEVTSKGRRKIFDGVRWQILCRRPECRKQTNKKSLCITHYKEEYESNPRSSSSSWPNNLQSYQLSSYKQQQQHLYDNTKTRSEIEDQNNTITTTNTTENSEQSSLNINNNQLIHDGQIEYRNNGRRFILKNNKWLPLCLNSSNLTTLSPIPQISITQTASHWFNILISQWNQNSYIPQQVGLAFIVNQTNIFEFLIFNSTQSTTTNWFSILRLISSQFWGIAQYQSTSIGQSQMIPLYTDSDCIRSFNCNFKYSTSGCTQDFYGFFFIYGGYRDLCIAAVRNISQVPVPSIFYCPTTAYTNGNLNYFNISNGVMGFIR
ncbi:unnamed protein product [Adineta steineri]|uniref:Uncharacterized protein n=2 Tax=Adineta steineri TaxID=433720 RepID=A0A813YEY5_9BILA|nr:unnamed protein product [Adineta steineri]